MAHAWLWLAPLWLLAPGLRAADGAGPYECIRVLRVEALPCDGEDCVRVHVRVMNTDEGRRITGNWSAPFAIADGATTTRARFFRLSSSGRWHATGDGAWERPCASMARAAPDTLRAFAAASGFEPRCPIPAGWHRLRGYDPCLRLRNFPAAQYGHFRYEVEVLHEGRGAGGFAAEVTVDPPPRPHRPALPGAPAAP